MKLFCKHEYDMISTPYPDQNSSVQRFHNWNFWVMCCTKCAKLKKVYKG